MDNILIHPDGTKAETVIGSIGVITTAALIRSSRVQYEVAYFDNSERRSVWMEEYELNFKNEPKVKVGYNSRT